MNSKLTLTIEKSMIVKAKLKARSKGRCLSDLIENDLKMITQEEGGPGMETTPFVKTCRGSFKAPDDLDYKDQLSKGLSDKYL